MARQRRKTVYYIDSILPSGEVHIVSGPSRIGKSALFMQLLYDWTKGEQVLGLDTHGQQDGVACMVTVDRSEQETLDAMERVGVPDDAYPVKSVKDVSNASMDTAFGAAPERTRILFVEGVDAIVTKPGDPHEVTDFLRYCGKIATERNMAIIVSTGTPKLKSNEQYLYAPERISGCAQWGRFSSTIFNLSFEDPNRPNDDKHRVLFANPRNAAPIVRRYVLDPRSGAYVEAADRETGPVRATILAALPADTTSRTLDEILQILGAYASVSGTTDRLIVGRSLHQLAKLGNLERDGDKFRRIVPGLALNP